MSVARVPVKPDVLNWAVRRLGISRDRLYRLFPKWDDWIAESIHPTLKQVEKISNATHTPIGFFYLPEPARLEIPIPDFRRMAGDDELFDWVELLKLLQQDGL